MTLSSLKPAAGSPLAKFTVPLVGGGDLTLASQTGWRMLVVYRGKHCPLCKRYLDTLNAMLDEFEDAGIAVAAVSADPLQKAQAQVAAQGLKFSIGYDLSVAQMQALGLYVSSPRSPEETDRPFSEPGLFVVNPDGTLQIVDLSNAPFARPDLASLLAGLKFVLDKEYPIRGTLLPDR